MIQVRNVTKRFGRAIAVDGVTLDIPAGDSVALWGMNGAGKTTLIRCVLGLLRFSGDIQVGGMSVRRHGKAARMLIGYVPQELGFYDDLSVLEAIGFFARLKGVRVRSVGDVLEPAGLPGQQRKRIRDLSGGMKQRLALAIAMLGEPPVLILDEVTASLDACGRDEFVGLLARLSDKGRTILFASHRIEEIATLAKRVVTLERGRLASSQTADRFVSTHGRASALHLVVPSEARERAASRLRDRGFDPVLNGTGIIVPVAVERKAAPIRILTEAGISIEDFDLVAGGRPQELASPRRTGGDP